LTMATLRKATRSELDAILSELVAIDEQERGLVKRKEELKVRFVGLAEKHLEALGPSRVWAGATKRVRATWPESTPTVDWDAFMREVGPDLFAEVCRVKGAELDLERWNEAVKEERVTDRKLEKCINSAKARRPSVYVEDLPKNGE
jgi:hypothetical protein